MSEIRSANVAVIQHRRHAAAHTTDAKPAMDRERQRAAKRDVFARWQAWQQEPSQYRSLEAFAIGMLDRHDCVSAILTTLNGIVTLARSRKMA